MMHIIGKYNDIWWKKRDGELRAEKRGQNKRFKRKKNVFTENTISINILEN